MAYSKKVIDKFESTLNEPEKNSVGRWNPSDADIGTGMVGAPACGCNEIADKVYTEK